MENCFVNITGMNLYKVNHLVRILYIYSANNAITCWTMTSKIDAITVQQRVDRLFKMEILPPD